MRILFFCFIALVAVACKKTPSTTAANTYIECETLIFDLTDGTMNGVKPNLNQGEIREWLPCYTRFTPNGGENDCGGALIYTPYHFAFYTYFNKYVEATRGFKGTVTDTLFSKNKTQVRHLLKPYGDSTMAVLSDTMDLFPTEYGCIRIHYEDQRKSPEKQYPASIAAHYCDCQSVEWCRE